MKLIILWPLNLINGNFYKNLGLVDLCFGNCSCWKTAGSRCRAGSTVPFEVWVKYC